MCGVFWQLKILFCRNVRNIITSFFFWGNYACVQWWHGLSLVTLYFLIFSLSSSWFSRWAWKILVLSFDTGVFSFRSFFFLFLIFFLELFVNVLFIFNVILQSQFVICYFFIILVLILLIVISLVLLLNWFFLILLFNQK